MTLLHDFEIVLCGLRPPCPRCGRKMWPRRGLDDEEVYSCTFHGDWVPLALERDGQDLPLFRWVRYDWRFA